MLNVTHSPDDPDVEVRHALHIYDNGTAIGVLDFGDFTIHATASLDPSAWLCSLAAHATALAEEYDEYLTVRAGHETPTEVTA